METPAKKVKLSQPTASSPVAIYDPQPRLPSPDEIFKEKHLPLLANHKDVHVHHYLMKLSTDFTKRRISGSVILFLEWLKPFERKIVLDQCFLKVNNVGLLKKASDYDVVKELSKYNKGSGNRRYFYRWGCDKGGVTDWFGQEKTSSSVEQLQFTQNKWSVTIQGWSEQDSPPSVIRIDYETLETSPSLHWRPCDGFNYAKAVSKCCYSAAPAVNNRGLFPCQEPPSAMATWEVLIECEKEYTPLVTSDEPGEIIGVSGQNGGTGNLIHYFNCSVPLPMSTFAMIIGKFCLETTLTVPKEACSVQNASYARDRMFCQNHSKYPCRFGDLSKRKEKWIPVRLFCLDQCTVPLLNLEMLSKVVFSSLSTSFHNFGPHPFSRQDIVIVPKSYPHECLTSPSMIFISPSNFYGDEPKYISRIPHEFCHNWFGLLIGSLDWAEEWLSEGFATYCEDVIFPTAYQTYFPDKSKKELESEQALKILMRFTSLQFELQNTQSELHMISTTSASQSQAVMNGLVPIKQFMNVHYYKGYLLLWHLAFLVGQSKFLEFLQEYVWRYHGQLVTSEIFLECYQCKFKDHLLSIQYKEGGDLLKSLKNEWLYSNKLPPPYDTLDLLKDTISEESVPSLFIKAIEPMRNINLILKKLIQDPNSNLDLGKFSCSELLLLLEKIIKLFPEASGHKRDALHTIYFQHLAKNQIFQDLDKHCNADLLHRWCELIVLFKDKSRLPVVKNFLKNNIAMGVYLYGELMITEIFSFQNAAKQLYNELEGVYDLTTKTILKEMIF